jgi:hypothetical protein
MWTSRITYSNQQACLLDFKNKICSIKQSVLFPIALEINNIKGEFENLSVKHILSKLK